MLNGFPKDNAQNLSWKLKILRQQLINDQRLESQNSCQTIRHQLLVVHTGYSTLQTFQPALQHGFLACILSSQLLLGDQFQESLCL